MKTKIIEATAKEFNWGKFAVCQMDSEWTHKSVVDTEHHAPLLSLIGWNKQNIWVLDLQTFEGASFRPGGSAAADLYKHAIWVCPLFEPFLVWLYKQDLSDISALPDIIDLPDAEVAMAGYRRPGPKVG